MTELANQVEAAADGTDPVAALTDGFAETRFDCARYIRDRLGWEPWAGTLEQPGQMEVIAAYNLALRQQFERDAYEKGQLTADNLQCWRPGEKIKNVIRIEAGHTVGKTKLASGIVNHFFDHFLPGITYTFAPSWPQVKDLLWKEISADRAGKDLPGRVLDDCQIKHRSNHFAKGKATNDAKGRGTERVHGQHERHLLFVIDEAEGVADFVFKAIKSMTSGGIVIVVMLANPRTRSSSFHKAKTGANVRNFRISCIHHPNVSAGKEVIPGAVRRHYVEEMVDEHCEVTTAHEPDNHTFTLPFEVTKGGIVLPPGTILRPDPEFLFRVLGIAPANFSDNTFITPGRYEAACQRTQVEADEPETARLGVDVARWGKDFGTLYVRLCNEVWREQQFAKQDSNVYRAGIKELARKLAARGVKRLRIRVDGGGGFASGVIDPLKIDMELRELFIEVLFFEVHNNGKPRTPKKYDDLVTEMYAETAETLLGVRLLNPPETLESDLTERQFEWVNRKGREVKALEEKLKFKDRVGRSPDDGDGCVLACAPDKLFRRVATAAPQGTTRVSPWL